MAKSKATPARRVKQTTVETTVSDGSDETEISVGGEGWGERDIPTPDALADLLGEEDGAVFKVYLLGSKPGDKPLTYCAEYTKESLSLETIRDSFGGGTYRISAKSADQRFLKNRTVSIFGLAKTAASTPGNAAPDSMLSVLMGLIQSQGTMIAAALARPEATHAPGPTFAEILQIIKAVEPREKSDPIEMLLKGLTLGRELGGDGGGNDLMGLAAKGLDAVKPLIAAQAAGTLPRANPRAAVIDARAGQPGPQNQPQATQPKTKEDMQAMINAKRLTWITQMTAQLVAWAQRGKNAELYAEVFLDNLPPFVTMDEIEARFSDPESISQLALLNPAVAECSAWIEEFRIHVLELLHQDDEEEAPRGGPVLN